MPNIKTIADKADVIINGYAFTADGDRIHVLNLNSPAKATDYLPPAEDVQALSENEEKD